MHSNCVKCSSVTDCKLSGTFTGYPGKPPWEDGNLADEALTLPLEDQDFRVRDFR